MIGEGERNEMGMPKYAAKVDRNQADIVDALKSAGCDVVNIRVPVDLAVGVRGKTFFLEVKHPKDGEKTDAQKVFFAKWRGHVAEVRTPEEALQAVGLSARPSRRPCGMKHTKLGLLCVCLMLLCGCSKKPLTLVKQQVTALGDEQFAKAEDDLNKMDMVEYCAFGLAVMSKYQNVKA